MVFRDRQGLSPPGDPNQSSNTRDRYLDNCFLLCINRNDNTDIPEIHRLENNPRHYIQDQQGGEISENYDIDEEDIRSPRQQKERDYSYRRKGNQQDRDTQTLTNRPKYQRDGGIDNSRPVRYNHRNDYNIMQHSDDELSVYEVYVPTNTLNRLSDKRIDNNMVSINYQDVSMVRDIRGVPSRNISSHYVPLNQYNDYSPQYQYDSSLGFPRERDGQQQFYQNNPLQQQQRLGGYYGNEGDRQTYSPQSGPFLPVNSTIDHSNAINVRRHIYSPSQLPQGLTEGQLVMLLQKGHQYPPAGQPFPPQQESQPTTTSAVTVSHQASSIPNTHKEPFNNPEYISPLQVKVPPQIIDHRLTDVDEITKPMSTLNPTYSKESEEKKKDKTSDVKKDKKSEKDDGVSSKKDGKKEKSSGKDSKKKKK